MRNCGTVEEVEKSPIARIFEVVPKMIESAGIRFPSANMNNDDESCAGFMASAIEQITGSNIFDEIIYDTLELRKTRPLLSCEHDILMSAVFKDSTPYDTESLRILSRGGVPELAGGENIITEGVGVVVWNTILDAVLSLGCESEALAHGLKESFAQVVGEETHKHGRHGWFANNHRWADLLKRFGDRVREIHQNFEFTIQEVADDMVAPLSSSPDVLIGDDAVYSELLQAVASISTENQN